MLGLATFSGATFSSFSGVEYFSTLDETATGTDAVSSLATFGAALSELSTGSDAISSLAVFNGTLSELATGSDSASATADFYSALSELSTGSDSSVGYITFPTSISESAVGTDVLTNTAILNAAFSDTVTGADVIIGAFLWNQINDAQNPNWTATIPPVLTGGDAGFSGGAFASSPISGAQWSYTPDVTTWEQITANTPTTWNMVN